MRLIDKVSQQDFNFLNAELIPSLKKNDIIDKRILNTFVKFLNKKKKMGQYMNKLEPGKHHFLAYLPKSVSLTELINEDKRLGLNLIKINEAYYGCKCMNQDDYGDDSTINHSWTRDSYSEFVFALNQGLHDTKNISTRNSVFEQILFIIEHDWTFGERFKHHALQAVKNNNITFSNKQNKKIKEAIECYKYDDNDDNDDDNDDNDDYPVDSDDEHENQSPGICPDCQDKPPGDYLSGYLCSDCESQEAGACNMYLESLGL